MAQIVQDNTLPVNSHIKNSGDTSTIEGGSKAGNNLFHSFEQFSVPAGEIAYFNNTSEIENILLKVTDSSVSNIDGMIQANGIANVFLLNPNGMIFGPNAQLNIGGSFVGSTASSIEFADGNKFSGQPKQTEPLLTVNVPVGLGFGNNSTGAIQVTGTGNQITPDFGSSPTTVGNSSTGLSVKPGKTLAIVGSNVDVEGGTITAEAGRIELGSVGSGSVSLKSTNQGWTFGYEGVSNFDDIQLSGQAVIDASGTGEGAIQIHGANVKLTDGSLILIQNRGEIPSGSLSVNASESLVLRGTSPDGNVSSAVRSETVSKGQGANITISTPTLVLQNGARIGTTTYSDGKGGNVAVNASDSVQLLSNISVNPSRKNPIVSAISAATYASGDAGSLQLSTKQLRVTDGGAVTSSTIGTGSGGDVTVNADAIEVIGIKPERKILSVISASSVNAGKAGSLTINTSQLRLTDGGTVTSSSYATGDAGRLTINAADSVEVSGTKNNVPSAIRSSVVPTVSDAARNRLGLPKVPSGFSGEVIINTKLLNINQGGLVGVNNEGTGDAGNLKINADAINLDDSGSITAASASGRGGNITINSRDLLLRHNSQISTSAGNAQAGGNGGRIDINTKLLVAVPQENSDITANAFTGRGGTVNITTQGVFGIQPRLRLTPQSDITASSDLGINGTVQINTPDVNPNPAIAKPVAIPETPLVASACQRGSAPSEFVITGTGGIPPGPDDLLESQRAWLPAKSPQNSHAERDRLTATEPTQIVEAQGWRRNPDGTVTLTAEAVGVGPYSSIHATPWCHSQPSSPAFSTLRKAAEGND